MKHTDPISDRQLRSLAATALLSPILRLVPGTAAELGGKAAWAGPLAVSTRLRHTSSWPVPGVHTCALPI